VNEDLNMLTRKRLLISAVVAVCAAFAIAATEVFGADSGATITTKAAPADPFAEVTTPTGPALPLEQVLLIARQEAERAGEPNPSFAEGTGTLEQAMGTFESGYTPPEDNADPGYQRLLDTPVDLILMTGEHFTMNGARVPSGTSIPTVEAMFVVIDSHRGEVIGRGLPTPEAVAHAESLNAVAAGQRGVIAIKAATGMILGKLTVSGGPAHRTSRQTTHTVVVKRNGRHVTVAHTDKTGAFRLNLRPATYVLKGTTGGDCQPKTVTVKPERTAHVNLSCSIR
jgi:hypothetical protein